MQEAKPKRWKGLLADEQPMVRRAVILVLFVLAASLPFSSMGFYPVGDAHVLVAIIPPALAALLLGRWFGCSVGALAGLAEFAHAIIQPYDYYEKLFSSPLNSIVLLALIGLFSELLFSCACRLPSRSKSAEGELVTSGMARIGAIAAASAAISLLFTVLMQCGIYLVNYIPIAGLPVEVLALACGAQGAVAQMTIHFLFIALPCIFMDAAFGRSSVSGRKPSIRAQFQIWFGALTVVFFFLASAVAYTTVTNMSLVNMNLALSDHLTSLTEDVTQRDRIVNTMDERGALPRENLREFARQQYRNINCDLPGWTRETVAIASNDIIFVSNDSSYVDAPDTDLLSTVSGDADIQAAFKSSEAVECYQGSGYEISYLFADEMGFERLDETGTYQFVAIVPASEVFLNRPLYMYLVAAVFAIMLGAVFILAMQLLRRVVGDPIDVANETLSRITAGELDQRVPDASSSDFSSLANGINITVGALEESIAEANTRIDRELETARAIQKSALPSAQPPFPSIDAFDLFATMDAAREVGGDFYDFFELGEGRVGFVVADVSGKGIPAALFMMSAKTTIRSAMETNDDLAEAIGAANRSLCMGNESDIFVTVFAGVFEYDTGKLSYVNAGHNKPLVMHGGKWSWLSDLSGPFLGTYDWIEYKKFEMHLEHGDVLFAYTDGVSEAFNVDGEQFGNERLENFLSTHVDLHPRRLLRSFTAELIGWSYGTEQSDDITMLALNYGIPPEHGATFVTTATLDNFEEVERFVIRMLDKAGCPSKESNHVMIAVEELVVNVCNYAYPDAAPDEPGVLRMHFTWMTQPNAVEIEIGDDGVPFNLLEREDPEKPASIEDAKIGGLGIFMTKKLMDEVEYLREGISNVTVIRKYWE